MCPPDVDGSLLRASLQRDLWLTCEPGDKDAAYLLGGLARAIDSDEATIAAFVARVAGHSPAQVCLILDDAHEIATGSDGAELIAELLDELPANGHVLISTRRDPPVALARLDAQSRVGWVDPDDLRLDEHEVAELAAEANVAVERLHGFDGWPALAALAARTRDVSDFLHEEVLSWLSRDQRSALEVSVAMGPVDSRLLLHLAGVTPDTLGDLPLIHKVDGWYVPHDLWIEAVDSLVPGERLDELRRRGIEYLLECGEGSRAIEACLRADEPELLNRAVRAVVLDPLDRNVSDVRRWLTGISDDGDRSAGEQYLAGVVAQHQDPTSIRPVTSSSMRGPGFGEMMILRPRSRHWCRLDTGTISSVICPAYSR